MSACSLLLKSDDEGKVLLSFSNLATTVYGGTTTSSRCSVGASSSRRCGLHPLRAAFSSRRGGETSSRAPAAPFAPSTVAQPLVMRSCDRSLESVVWWWRRDGGRGCGQCREGWRRAAPVDTFLFFLFLSKKCLTRVKVYARHTFTECKIEDSQQIARQIVCQEYSDLCLSVSSAQTHGFRSQSLDKTASLRPPMLQAASGHLLVSASPASFGCGARSC